MGTLIIRKEPLTDEECLMIADRVFEEKARVGTAFVQDASKDTLIVTLRQLSLNGYLLSFVSNEGKLIGILIWDVGNHWWSTEVVITEMFVFCIDKDFKGFGRVALHELDVLAKRYKAKAIVAGSYFLREPQIVTNMYKKFGYSEESPSYIKIIREDDVNV